ncbi:MAG: hypothetical protein VW362_07160, partial [Candidatus Nanopelagicales bacterium]
SWMTYSNTTGYTPGDFDVSYKVMFPTGSSDRDIANFGFWLDGNYSSMKGYAFRLQTANGDGGFLSVTTSSKSLVSGASKAPNVTRGHWYQVRLTAVSGYVTAYVIDLSNNNALFFTQTLKITTSPPGGVFGQVPDGDSSSTGIRWDDFAIHSLANMPGQQTIVKGPNQVWIADGSHSGIGRASLYTTSQANMPFEYSTDDSAGYPAQGTFYTYSAWLRAASGSISGTLSLSALGGSTETASVPFTVGSSWTQVAVSLEVGLSGHTDLRPRITVGTTNAELQVDDQVLQQLPWEPYNASNGASTQAVTSAYAHSGTNSMQATDLTGNGATMLYQWPTTALAGEMLTYSAWVLAPTGVSGQLRIAEQSGWSTQAFTANGTWQQITVTRTMQGGSAVPYIAVDINSGQKGEYLYVDDASVTVTDIASNQSGVGTPPAPSGWTATQYSGTNWATQKSVAPLGINNASLAHSGSGVMYVQVASPSMQENVYTVAESPQVGSTWAASVWVKTTQATNKNGSFGMTLTAGQNVAQLAPATSGTGWQQFTVTLPITKSGATSLALEISVVNGVGAYIDDVSITEVGLTPVDAWTPYAPTGFLGIEGVNDPTNAYAGDGYLQVTNDGTGAGAAYLDGAYQPVAGTAHEMSFWIKSPQGNISGAAAWLRTQDSGGTTLDSYQASIPITGTWQQVFLSLPIKNNVESRDVNYWSAVQPGSGIASITIEDNVDDAANGPNYLRFITSGAGGGVGDTITADTSGAPIDVIAGSSYKLEAYVRSTSGANINGTMSLATANGSTTADSASVAFTATSGWTLVELMLDTTKNANTMIPKVTLNGAGQLDVDSVSLVPVLIEQTDPWSASGSGVTWGVYDDPDNAYDSSYGVMEFSVATAGTGVQHGATQSTSVGDQLSATAMVRTGGARVSGTVQVTSVGGTKETWTQDFTATGDW